MLFFCGLLAVPVAGEEAAFEVRPGGIVRWPAAGAEGVPVACQLGERRFEPLGDVCLFPIDLLRPAGRLDLLRWRGGRPERRSVTVGEYPYPVQRIQLPDDRMVHLSPEDLERVLREKERLAPLWALEGERRFTLPLHPPLLPLPAGGRFGSRRIINGEPRSPHSGVDYPARRGEAVLAIARGVVRLSDDLFFGGNSVFIDHGDGLVSMYMHLSRVDVAAGQQVERGQRIGAVGSTGRATGPHLHFGIRWHGARVDPALLLGPTDAIPKLPRIGVPVAR
jgi:murein DD-endopeptidase MepM/ murein hydrolase activator NlpD